MTNEVQFVRPKYHNPCLYSVVVNGVKARVGYNEKAARQFYEAICKAIDNARIEALE